LVGLLGIHLRYAGVDRDDHGYAEDDGCRPEDCGNCDEGSGACDGAMLVSGAKDKQEGQTVPEGYDFAQDASKRRGDLGVGAVVQLSEYRLDEAAMANSLPAMVAAAVAVAMS
jgi:hypothetical protein